jgi:hypothetical protein
VGKKKGRERKRDEKEKETRERKRDVGTEKGRTEKGTGPIVFGTIDAGRCRRWFGWF